MVKQAVPITKIQTLIKEQKYNNAIYCTLCNLLPQPPSKENLANNTAIVNFLVEVYKELPKLLNTEPILKATYLISIANSINNKVANIFTPEYYNTIKVCGDLQKVAVAYVRRAFLTLNQASVMLPFERVNDLNFLLIIAELNLCIILMSDKGRIYKDDELVMNLKTINERLTSLIQKDPNPEYYKTQSLVLRYLGDIRESQEASLTGVKSIRLKNSLANIDKLQYKMKFTGKLHPVVVYK